jgi:hypothetical protein
MPVVGPFFEDGREAMIGLWEDGDTQVVLLHEVSGERASSS